MSEARQGLRVARTPTPEASVAERAPRIRRMPKGPRRARLLVSRVDPVSVLRWSLVAAVTLVIALVVIVACLYALLDAMGVFTAVLRMVGDLGVASSASITALPTVLKWTAVVAAAIGVIGAAALTLVAFAFNLVSDVVGGPEVTLTERR